MLYLEPSALWRLSSQGRVTDMTGTHKTAARIAGVLFIIATVVVIPSSLFLGSVDATDYLTKAAGSETQIAVGVLMRFIAAFACVGIALALYPVIRRYRPGLALGAVAFRLIETTAYVFGAVSVLVLMSLSQEFVKTAAGDPAYFQASGTILRAFGDWAGLAGILAFYVGALMYYRVFYQARLVPRWLTAWGIGGVGLGLVAAMLVLFGATDSMSAVQMGLNAPIGVQEMVLAVWLIVKGFNPAAEVAAGGTA
jgi:hypothetical protein